VIFLSGVVISITKCYIRVNFLLYYCYKINLLLARHPYDTCCLTRHHKFPYVKVVPLLCIFFLREECKPITVCYNLQTVLRKCSGYHDDRNDDNIKDIHVDIVKKFYDRQETELTTTADYRQAFNYTVYISGIVVQWPQ